MKIRLASDQSISFYKFLDYVPLASNVKAIFEIYRKYVVLPNEDSIRDPIDRHIYHKSLDRLLLLALIPLIINIVVGIFDFLHRKQNNKASFLEALEEEGAYIFTRASQELKDDFDVVCAVVAKQAPYLEKASSRLRNDVQVGRVASNSANEPSSVLVFGGESCRDDEEIVMNVADHYRLDFSLVSARLRAKKSVVLRALSHHSDVYDKMDPTLREDVTIKMVYKHTQRMEALHEEIRTKFFRAYFEKNYAPGENSSAKISHNLTTCLNDLRAFKENNPQIFNQPQLTNLEEVAKTILEGDGTARSILAIGGGGTIDRQYKVLSFMCHPDKNIDEEELATIVFTLLNNASDFLKN